MDMGVGKVVELGLAGVEITLGVVVTEAQKKPPVCTGSFWEK
jgi:hypothetical protein